MMNQEQSPTQAPPVVAKPGWTKIEPPRLEAGRGTFVSGEPEGGRLRVAYFRREQDERLVGRAWFGPGSIGPPGHAHGGSMAAVLDDAMGAAAWLAGYPAVAVNLQTNFRRMLPIGTDSLMEAWVERVDQRKVTTRGVITDEKGEPFADAEALFLILDQERFGHLLEEAARIFGLSVDELVKSSPPTIS